MFRFALACMALSAFVLTSDGVAAPVTSSATINAGIAACIPGTFTCDTTHGLNLSDPTFTSGSLFSSIIDPKVSATYTASFTGMALASFDASVISVKTHITVFCSGSGYCFEQQILFALAGQSEAQLTLSDQITFFTGLGSGFYEIMAHENRNILFNGSVTAAFQGTPLQSQFGGFFTTAPMPFVDGVPFTLNVSARADGSACCNGSLDAANVDERIELTLIALDTNLQPIKSLGYIDSTGKPYKFTFGETGTLLPEPSSGILVLTAVGLGLCRWAVRGKLQTFSSRGTDGCSL